MHLSLSARRAWIEIRKGQFVFAVQASLSARRAWIEILTIKQVSANTCVALRKESVDRNAKSLFSEHQIDVSLSARRAWIEMLTDDVSTGGKIKVALRKESVDRNNISNPATTLPSMSLSARRAWIEIKWIKNKYPGCRCRSPQGERG